MNVNSPSKARHAKAATPQAARSEAAQSKAAAARHVSVARRVLYNEAEAIVQLAERLDASFDEAVQVLAAAQGRVVVTGMGKSGHVARKIAASLASTGTPAQFVHPAESSHGDLGMIKCGDVLLALSNSGNTVELNDLLSHCARYAIPLVGISKNANSTLAEFAKPLLLLPPVEEACSLGLMPTTSTTMQMALGDALAVALLEHRGFTANDFQRFHPGGTLGQQLLRVSDIAMKGDQMPLVRSGVSFDEALLVMSEVGRGCVGVLGEARQLIGVMTDGDLRRARLRAGSLQALQVDDIMTRNPHTIKPDALAAEALGQFNRLRITGLFMVDEAERPVGFVDIHDCLRAGLR